MEKKRKRLTNREWWAKYGEHPKEQIAFLEKKSAEGKAAREEAA